MAAQTTPRATESVAVFTGQLKGHRVQAVTLHTKAHNFRVTLRDGRKVTVAFTASEQQRLLADARANGVTVKVAEARQPSHKRRYIAIAVAVVAVLALGIAAWLFVRRRRLREEEYGPRGR